MKKKNNMFQTNNRKGLDIHDLVTSLLNTSEPTYKQTQQTTSGAAICKWAYPRCLPLKPY